MPQAQVPFQVTGFEPDPAPLELRGTMTIEHGESGPVLHLDHELA